MRRLIPLLALVPAVAAQAGPKPSAFIAGADRVDIAGPVEVPLLRSAGGPAVLVTSTTGEGDAAKEHVIVAIVDIASLPNIVSSATVGALGLEASGKEGAQWVVIPELHIGALVLYDLLAIVDGPELAGAEMILGAGTLEEVATAILVSQGTVKFVPAADGAALLASVGTPAAAEQHPTETYYDHGTKVEPREPRYAVRGVIGGHAGRIALSTATYESLAQPRDAGFTRTEWTIDRPKVGDVDLPTVAVGRLGANDPDDFAIGRLGWDALHGVDLAIDPASDQFALRPASVTRGEPAALDALTRAKKDYDDANKTPEATEEEEEDAPIGQGDKGDKTKVATETQLAGAYLDTRFLVSGSASERLAHLKAAAAAAGDDCSPHLAYGTALIELAGDPTTALPELVRAAEAYDRWMAQDRLVRAAIEAGKNKDPEAFVIAQAPSCHKAWGDVAEAHLALGDHAKVAEIYANHTDLDADLPLAHGLSLLAQGKASAAVGPLRRAIELDARNHPIARAALVMTGEAAPNGAATDRLVAADVEGQLATLFPMLESVRSRGGNAEARGVAEALAKADPFDVPALLLHAREVADAERPAALAAVATAIAAYRRLHGEVVEADAWEGLHAAMSSGNSSSIRATAAEFPGHPEAETAAMIAFHDDGNSKAARAHHATLLRHTPLSAATGLPEAWFSARVTAGPPGSPKPPTEAPAPVYTTGCAEIPAVAYDAPIAGTWVATSDLKDRIAFNADRWCIFDDTGTIRAQGAPASWSIYACPGESPAADQPVQETYLVFRDAAHGLTTCNRFVQLGDHAGLYGQACPGEPPYSTYGASGRIGQWTRTQDPAPTACWVDAPAPKGK